MLCTFITKRTIFLFVLFEFLSKDVKHKIRKKYLEMQQVCFNNDRLCFSIIFII